MPSFRVRIIGVPHINKIKQTFKLFFENKLSFKTFIKIV